MTGTVCPCDVFKPGCKNNEIERKKQTNKTKNDGIAENSLCAMAMTPERGIMRLEV